MFDEENGLYYGLVRLIDTLAQRSGPFSEG
jgi:hypothetical protein